MKLYALTLSPFAARVRLALSIKGISYEQEAPPGGTTRSPEYLAINPIGKLPVLITDDGLVVAESETIIDYLEDHFPRPSLIPTSDAARIQMRNAIRTQELYVVPSLFRLFAQLDPSARDEMTVSVETQRLRDGLSLLQHFVDDAPFAVGGLPSKADCIILPTLLLCGVVMPLVGVQDILADFPVLSGYAIKARTQPDMGTIWEETAAALAASQG